MGLFSNMFGGGQSKPVSLNRQEAFCGFLLSVIAADGVITNEEMLDFYSAVNKAQVMESVSQDQFRRIVQKLVDILKKKGFEELLQLSALGTTPDMNKGVFAYTCDLVFSDSNVDPAEARIMDRIKQLLNIDDDFAAKAGRVAKAKASV
jgi:uncharacterized tellurite resistance protein B-like protein